MRIAFGIKAHSGWAAFVALGALRGEPEVVDRRRMELVEEDEIGWAKQPYHAAESAGREEGRSMVRGAIRSARRIAIREMRAAVKRAREAGHEVVACAVLVGDPMPDWTIHEILAVHFRMHKAEGFLFRDALARAAAECGLRFVPVPEKAREGAIAARLEAARKIVAGLGKSVGPPWGKDQKDAAAAAWIALQDSKITPPRR